MVKYQTRNKRYLLAIFVSISCVFYSYLLLPECRVTTVNQSNHSTDEVLSEISPNSKNCFLSNGLLFSFSLQKYVLYCIVY